MTHFQINPRKFSPVVLDLIGGSLRHGQVVVLPTDTIYGFSCLANNSSAINKIYKLKKRDRKKPLLVLVSSLTMLKRYAFVSSWQEVYLKKEWSKPNRSISVILRHRGQLSTELTVGTEGLAFRLPKSNFLIKIIRKVNFPIVSTSLNLSGQAVICNLHKLLQYFPKKINQPDLVIDTGICRRTKPSSLIDLREKNKQLILRK